MTGLKARLADWLERSTTASRRRNAAGMFMFGESSPTDRAVASAYFALMAGRWARHGDDPHHLAPFVAGLDTCRAPQRVLDIGTGTGSTAAMVAERYPDADVTAIDTSRQMLREAEARHRRPNLRFERTSAMALAWPDGHFDLVVFLNAVPEMEELARVAAPGAEVLAAATTMPLRADDSAWVARWREMGFRRVGHGAVGRGSWERYERDDSAASADATRA